MDPSFSIDLKTIAGIVALTIAIVHYLKGWLASVPVLEKVPVAVYVVFVSMLLTLLSHDVFHLIAGDRGELLLQALAQALAASGVVEWWRAGAKPLDESQRAQDVTMKRGGFYLIPILLAVGLSVGCAKMAPIAIAGEQSLRATIVMVSQQVEPLVCNPEARKVLTSRPCLHLLDALDPATELAMVYNRALAANQVPDLAATIRAVDNLIAAIRDVVPDNATRAAALQHLALARGRAQGAQ